jgi:hypothetical protein
MIGLGDIIIPGLLSSMCLRIDLINSFKISKEKAQKDGVKDIALMGEIINEELKCFHFNFSLFGYLLGFIFTYLAMDILKTP